MVREYLAVTQGEPPAAEGLIDLPIAKAEGATVRRCVSPAGKPAVTHYRVLRRGGGRALVLLRLETGRTHQIRVHLAALGCPVAGDFLYGEELTALPGRFALHSHRLLLRHPLTGEEMTLCSPLPPALGGAYAGMTGLRAAQSAGRQQSDEPLQRLIEVPGGMQLLAQQGME